jgi:hypothetical protein
VLTVPATPPLVVPSGMRTSGLRGGAGAAGVVAAGFAADAAVDDVVVAGCAEVPEAVERNNVDVELVPGAVSDSGAGSRLPGVPAAGAALRCVVLAGRRLVLVETNPVLLAPEPDGLPKLGSWLVSGLSKFGSPAGRVSGRRTARRGASRRGSSVSSKAGRRLGACLVAGCANPCAAASAATTAPTSAGATRPEATTRRT